MLLRNILIVLAGTSLIGCSASLTPSGSASNSEMGEAQLAAYAASTPYPDKSASDDLKLSAMVDRNDKSIQLANYSDKTLTDAKVWVNQTYLYKVSAIPAHGYTTLSTADFYNGSGQLLSQLSNPINRVEVQTGDDLYSVMGPVFK